MGSVFLACGILAAELFHLPGITVQAAGNTEVSANDASISSIEAFYENYYEYQGDLVKSYSDIQLEYGEMQYAGVEGELLLPEKTKQPSEEHGTWEWEFTVAKSGLYEIEADYLAEGGNGAKIQRKLMIDGSVPFQEANNICFYRRFIEDEEIKINAIGDEVWPKQHEEVVLQTQKLVDSQGFFEEPLMFYLSEGKHTISMAYVDQPINIQELRLIGKEDLPSYEELAKEYADKGYQPVSSDAVFLLQAEDSSWKSDSVVRRESNEDPKTQPFNMTSRVLNTVGGYRWRMGNQSISWNIEAKESGLYQLNFKVLQSRDGGMPSFRSIAIDGEVPCQELNLYTFPYSDKWYGETLSNENGEPYLIYLEKGTHELTMTVKMGPLADIIERTTKDTQVLSEISREIIKITGANPDPNYEYELYRIMPGLSGELAELANRIEESADILASISNKRTSMENNYRQIVEQLRKFSANVDRIPKALGDLDTAQGNLGTYITTLEKSPLAIDYIEAGVPGSKFKIQTSNFFERLWVTVVNFFLSFVKDYDSIGGATGEGVNEVLDVWIARGSEWGEVLKELADEQFTPTTGIGINLNVVPSNQLSTGSVNTLMMSITSGTAPDVALSVAHNLPSEFAFRDAAVDLTQFEGFEETVSQFYPDALKPYRFMEGVYALPETMDFTVMMYRKDIMAELGLNIPRTWTQLYQEVLPVLYENSMSFSLPVDTSQSSNSADSQRGFTMMLLQNGGAYYTEDGKKSALDSPEAYQAFKVWTEMYSNYDVDEESNLFSRMRAGTMPIGIGNYATYMQLSTSAPELYGRWGIAPVPGTELADGTISHAVGTMSSTACMIFEQSDKKDAAWEFLQWWMSEETQIQYGRELEALIGTSARWNTANVSAFTSLPWEDNNIDIITAQMAEAREQYIVPGGYFTGRHIINAWNRTILGNESARDSLEAAVKDINKELDAKMKEFGLENTEIISQK